MASTTCILILGLQHFVLGHDCDRKDSQLVLRKQLKEDLGCNYYGRQPPKAPYYKPTTVSMKFFVEYFNLDLNKNVLYLETLMYLTWQDERLKWDPSKYGGIESIQLKRYNIWSPTFNVYNSADPNDLDVYNFNRCGIKNTGEVICVPRMKLQSHCNFKLVNFPYDVHECNFIIGPADDSNSYNVSFDKTITILEADYISSWKVLEYREQALADTKRQKITFVFRREASGLASVVVYPAFIVSGLSVACLFLDFRSNMRLMFICFSILCHNYWLTQIIEYIPTLSSDTPIILLYYRSSLFLSLFIILITFILNVTCKSKRTPNNIVINCNKFVYESRLKFLVSSRWEGTNDDERNEDWMKFANVVNSVCIIAVFVTYFSLYIAYMPQISPVK